MIIRRERPADRETVRAVLVAAFETPMQADLVDRLRASAEWLPELALVACDGNQVIAAVVCSRAHLDPVGTPVLSFGPIAVHPEHQGGKTTVPLMHAMIAAAEARGEAAILLFGDVDFYPHFGFEPAGKYAITPVAGGPHRGESDEFLVRTLAAYEPSMTGSFRYSPAFSQ